MIKFENVKVLKIGRHELKDGGMMIGSTVTLIKSDKNIIVDTGGFGNDWKEIELALEKQELKPENIDIVILTHLHIDHTANANMFKTARVYLKFHPNYPGQFHEIGKGILQRFELEDKTKIAQDVSIILTPGHTWDMVSVVVETDKGKIVIAGDAIPKLEWVDLDKKANANLIWDMNKFDESREKILEIADWIIPGHGDLFKVKK